MEFVFFKFKQLPVSFGRDARFLNRHTLNVLIHETIISIFVVFGFFGRFSCPDVRRRRQLRRDPLKFFLQTRSEEDTALDYFFKSPDIFRYR